jgi:hypothetical protein
MRRVDTAEVDQIRELGAYRLIVLGYRSMPVGLLILAAAVAGGAFREALPVAVIVVGAVGMALILAGIVAAMTGAFMLYTRKLMPAAGTERHAAFMQTFRSDVLGPLARRRS